MNLLRATHAGILSLAPRGAHLEWRHLDDGRWECALCVGIGEGASVHRKAVARNGFEASVDLLDSMWFE